MFFTNFTQGRLFKEWVHKNYLIQFIRREEEGSKRNMSFNLLFDIFLVKFLYLS